MTSTRHSSLSGLIRRGREGGTSDGRQYTGLLVDQDCQAGLLGRRDLLDSRRTIRAGGDPVSFSAGPTDQELLDLWLVNALPEHDGGEATPARALRAVFNAGQEQVMELIVGHGQGLTFRYEDVKGFIRKLDKYEFLRQLWREGQLDEERLKGLLT